MDFALIKEKKYSLNYLIELENNHETKLLILFLFLFIPYKQINCNEIKKYYS